LAFEAGLVEAAMVYNLNEVESHSTSSRPHYILTTDA